MKMWKKQGNRRKSPVWIMGRVAVVLLLSLLLAGCSRERMDTRREIDRIYKEAEKVAEDRATVYISEKYGIEAVTEGYWVQAYNDFFAPYQFQCCGFHGIRRKKILCGY